MKLTGFLVMFVLLFAAEAQSQSFAPLLPGSDYACITFPNGKAEIGQAGSDGYTRVGTGEATSSLQKRLSATNSRVARLIDLKQDLETGPAFPKADMTQILTSAAEFLNGTPPGTGVTTPVTKQEQLDVIKNFIKQFTGYKSTLTFQIKAVNDCVHKKPIPPPAPGELTPVFIGNATGVFVVLFGSAKIYNNPFAGYCVKGANLGTTGIVGLGFSGAACNVRGCSRPGDVAFVLTSDTGTTYTPAEIDSIVAQFSEEFTGAYEVRSPTGLTSCAQAFK